MMAAHSSKPASVDGVPQVGRYGFRGDVADTALFDRVEVVRGASGLLNGIGEPSGAVNLVRKLPTAEFKAHTTAKVGSWNHYRVDGDIGGPIAAEGAVRARMVAAYQDSDDFIDRMNQEKRVLYGVAQADVGESSVLTFGIEYQDLTTSGGSRFGVPLYLSDGPEANLPRSTNLAASWGYSERSNLSFSGSAEHFFDNGWRLELDLEHAARDYDNVMPALSNASVRSTGGSGTVTGRRWAGEGANSSARFHAVGPYELFGREHELVIGTSYSHFDGESWNFRSFGTPVPDAREFIRTGDVGRGDVGRSGGGSRTYDWQSGAYAATRIKPLDPLAVIVGARISDWKTRRDRFDASHVETRGPTTEVKNEVTPYFGAVVDVTRFLSVYASYTDIFKPANERDVNGELLEPAVGSNLEGGVKLAFFDDKLNVSAAYYETKKDNVPEYVPGPGGATNYGPTGDYVYAGIDGTKTTGYELEIAGRLTSRWEMSGGFNHTDPRAADGAERLTEIPTDTFKLFTAYRLPGVLEGLTLGGNVRWQNESYYEYTGFYYRQGDVTVVDLMAQYRITPKWLATLNVNNVFDETYFTFITGSGWYGTPRATFLTMRFDF